MVDPPIVTRASRQRRRRLRAPLWAVLLALVLPPVGGVGFLARREMVERQQTADVAREVVDLTNAFVALADLRSAVSSEQMYASALAAVNIPGTQIPPALIEQVLGGDIRKLWLDDGLDTDRAFRQVRTLVLEPSLAGAGPLDVTTAQRLVVGHDNTRALGAAFADGAPDYELVSRTYGSWGIATREALDAMAEHLAGTASLLAGAQGMSRQVEAVRRHVALSATMSGEVTTSASLLLGKMLDVNIAAGSRGKSDEATLRADLVENGARREVGVAELEKLFDASATARWQAIRQDPRVVSFEKEVSELGRAPVGTDLPAAAEVAQLAKDGLARIELTNEMLPILLADVATTADRAHHAATDRRHHTQSLVELMVGGTLVLLTGAVFAVTRPLRHMRKRARAVRDGDLEPATRVGSVINELHDVQLVFEDIVSNFRAIEAQATAIVDGDLRALPVQAGQPARFGRSVQESLGRLADVTRQLQTSEAMSNAIVETAAEAIWVLDADGGVLRANAASRCVTLVDDDEIVGRPFLDLVDPIERDLVAQLLRDGDLDSIEVRLLRPGNATVPVLLSSSRVVVGGDHLTTVIGRDITERKDFELQLEHNAATDSLTGLPNRRTAVNHLGEALDQARDHGGGVGVVFCDLDGFKQANDVHGHHFGDDVLREVARRFRNVVRDGELLARLGGDEFIVVASAATGLEEVNRLAARLLDSLQDTVVIGDRRVRINGSFGVAWSSGGLTTSDLLREADVAMFTAKAGGGGQVQLFDEDLQQSLRARVDIEAGLRQALANDELHFVYQPIVAAGSHEVVGVEALLRWDRPGRGSVSPAIFIPVAEQSDLVIELGRWGLRAAARQLVEWDALLRDRDFYIAVNVAGVHLSRYDIVADVRAALEEHSVDPRRFRIEITETQLVDDLDVAAEAMRGLAALGIPVVIDDYGTGFSSIAYLRQLPVRGIKIDRSFITQLENERDRAMVESLVILAGLLDLEVTAEGVETEQQLMRSEQIGCNHVQGFLVSRPVASELIEAKLQRVQGALRRADIAAS